MAIFGRRGLLKALPFAGVAALSAQPHVSRSLEDRLRTAIDKLEVVNTHEHTLPERELIILFFMILPIGAGLLVRRNIRLGRGDRRGSFRLASVAFIGLSRAQRGLAASHPNNFRGRVVVTSA